MFVYFGASVGHFNASCLDFIGSLRSKHFRGKLRCLSRAKVGARAKKRNRGEGERREGNARRQTPGIWKTRSPANGARDLCQFMTTDDSFKFLWVRAAVTEQVDGFQIPGVCLQAFPSLLSPSTRLSCFALAPTFTWLKHRNLPRKRLLRRLLHRLHWHSQDLQPLKIRFLLHYPSQRIDFKIRSIHAVYTYSYVAVRWQHLI